MIIKRIQYPILINVNLCENFPEVDKNTVNIVKHCTNLIHVLNEYKQNICFRKMDIVYLLESILKKIMIDK